MGKWMRRIAAMGILFWWITAPEATLEAIQVAAPPGAVEWTAVPIEDGKVLVSAVDRGGNPVRGLTARDFSIMDGNRRAEIFSVETLESSADVRLNIVMVVDNSASMRQRRAVDSMLTAMDALLKVIRPIDRVHLIVFDDRETLRIGNRDIHVRMLQSNNPDHLKAFLNDAFTERLTDKTVLYEAMLAGIDIIRQMPENDANFMVVFSDGEDINSTITKADVRAEASAIGGFEAYAVDYMPGSGINAFLNAFAAGNRGRSWKADAATDLVPIFKEVSSKLLYRYVVSYGFPPSGTLIIQPESITIEEITTIDSSPMLGYVYFDTGSSEIPDRYHRLGSPSQAASFSEAPLRGTLEKYHHLLNVIGRRLSDDPDASIRIVGCNADSGVEKGNKVLSRLRAESVKAYLQYVWGITPGRMAVEARNRPRAPSTNRLDAGRADNQRVEIRTDSPGILDVIESTYVEARMDRQDLTLRPAVDAVYPIVRWTFIAAGGGDILASLEGRGPLAGPLSLPLDITDPEGLARAGEISVSLELEDEKRQLLQLSADPVTVRFIQKKELMANRMGYKVLEKYALILFDFDSARIEEGNQIIVDRIARRVRALDSVRVDIVGHTDNIGKDDYNVALSERRAKAAYDHLIAAVGTDAADRIRFSGMGPFNAPYDNSMPETRAFNRTVTITLEYETAD
jgi:outer membrane protein OmpA-like peptidoglycan-associated protein/Mg-chelatase subunit ChlD